MNAPMFLSAFLGCLFALTFVTLGAWGILKWRTKRFLSKNAKEIADRFKQDLSPSELAEMEAFAREFSSPKREVS